MSEFADEEQLLIDTVRRFAVEQLAEQAGAIDESEDFAGCHIPAMADLGLMGLNLPECWGGVGITAAALLESVAAVAGGCAATASLLTAHFLATDALLLGGGDPLKQRFLPLAARGDMLGAFALTEPDAGSNPADMRTRAERTASGYRIRGAKQFISNAAHADFVVVFALTDAAARHRGISAFVV